MEDKDKEKIEGKVSDWLSGTEDLVSTLTSLIDNIEGNLTEEQKKEVKNEVDKLNIGDFGEQIRKAMQESISKFNK